MCKLSNVGSIPALPTHTDVAQLIERSLHAGNVGGLSPSVATIIMGCDRRGVCDGLKNHLKRFDFSHSNF